MEDRHHIIYPRQEWRLRDDAREIREHPSLVPTLNREIHEEIHMECPVVPLLGFHALRRVRMSWYPDEDTMRSVDNLLGAIDLSTKHPRVHPVERELAHLTMEAIELQKPYLRSDSANIIDLGVYRWNKSH